MSKINLLNYDRAQLEKFFTDRGEKSFRAGQLLKWIHQLSVTDFSCMTNFNLKLREYLMQHAEVKLPEVAARQKSLDGTEKWLLHLADHHYIEMVFIPEEKRGTLCVSTQVGCALKCAFCVTGKMGFTRNLSTAEIIGQLWLAVHHLASDQTTKGHVITNVVLMGMGEPLLNLPNVIPAIHLMLDDFAYGLSKRRVTVSTVGLLPELAQLREASDVALALSLHAPTDELRSQLLPINRRYPLAPLLDFCRNYYRDRRRRITIEYVMIKGVNDTPQQARQLIKILSRVPCKINLIPLNDGVGTAYQASPQETIDKFREILMAAGFNAITRKTRGSDIAAACGQLKAINN